MKIPVRALDHKVPSRSERWIAEKAGNLRRLVVPDAVGSFNIAKFVEHLEGQEIERKGRFGIDRLSVPPGLIIAYVTYEPVSLHIDRDIIEEARDGEPRSRFILAHELGHVFLHDKLAVAFSENERARLQSVNREESAEWQAEAFAYHLLVPPRLARSAAEPFDIAANCQVDLSVATHCFERVRARDYFERLVEDTCWNCGNITLVRNGTRLTCDTCSATS